MSAPPFKVKAIYDYTSPHEDDLNFSIGQLITITAEEDADWYMGKYTDGSGEKKQGLFPKNFVERYEPKTPPRPARILRPREENEVPPPPPQATEREAPARPSVEIQDPMETGVRGPVSAPAPVPEETPGSALPTRAAEVQAPVPELPPAPKPAPVAPAAPSASGPKATPPVIAEKPSSFKDRIAAFNKAAAPPVAPFKPPGAAATSFIKKPFVAPPPSRNSYVPPPIHEAPPQKIYRREEDSEIAEREAEDQAIAEKAGLASHDGPQEGEESAKPTSLKDRIALLQKQQMEQAQRRAEVTQKEKPKRPPKKQIEPRESAEIEGPQEGAGHEQMDPESRRDDSMDVAKEAQDPSASSSVRRRESRGPVSPEIGSRSDAFSDGNEADQSAAGETTEEPETMSSDGEDAEEKRRSGAHAALARAPAAPAAEPDVGDGRGTAEDDVEEEDDMDAETRRRMELRERMAKMSGGMGMAGMFGPPGAMPMPGAAPLRKKKPTGDSEAAATAHTDTVSTSPPLPPQRLPMVPIPGMQRPKSPAPEGAQVVEKEEEPALPITEGRGSQEVPDVEDLQPEPASRAQYAERTVPPPVQQERSIPAPAATIERGAPPPVPGNRPGPLLAEARALPPSLADILRHPSPMPASDNEMSLQATQTPAQLMSGDTQLPVRGAPPPVPSAARAAASLAPRPQGPRSPQSHAAKRASYFAEPGEAAPPTSPAEKRSSRVPPVPPVPIGSPTMSSPSFARPPPPPPPTAAPPSRASTTNEQTNEESDEGETEYEGDYDTDIALGATHRGALKSYGRESSYDSATADESSVRSPEISAAPPPLPAAGASRAVPPPPPHHAPRDNRQSIEPRAAPPPIPSRDPAGTQDDIEYDPYRYSSPSTVPSTDASYTPTRVPEAPVDQGVHSSPSMRRPMETTHGMQSQAAYQHDRPPPLPPAQVQLPVPPATHPRTTSQMPRQSLDVRSSTSTSRRSMDQPRSEHGFIAADVDFAEASQWWSVPNTPPPVLQGRMGKDILYEIEESRTSKRGGKTMISRDVYVLYMDYSQSTITALFDAQNPTDVIFEQRHKEPPPRLRQDQLEEAYRRFGARIAEAAARTVNMTVGDGTPHGLVLDFLKAFPNALHPVGTRAYGALVYANLANASIQQHDEIRPGDIMTLRNAKLQGKHGSMHKNYSLEVGTGGQDHVGIVWEWDGTKKKVRMLEQGREIKEGKKGKAEIESYKLGDLKSGEVKVWRIVDRGWVGWEGSN